MEETIDQLPDPDNFDLSGFIAVQQMTPYKTVKWNLAEVKGMLGVGSLKKSLTTDQIKTAGGVAVPFSVPLPPGSWSIYIVSALLVYVRAIAIPAFDTIYMRYTGADNPFASVSINPSGPSFSSFFKLLDVNGNSGSNFVENADVEMYTSSDSPDFDGSFSIIIFGQAVPSPL